MSINVNKAKLLPFFMNRGFRKWYASMRGILRLNRGLFLILTSWMPILLLNRTAFAQEKSPIVRLAKLQIDTTQLESYKAALKEEIETSMRVEPGVLTLNAVSEKDNPTHITIFEIYSNEDSYKSHLETLHFKKYKSTIKEMVKSLELIETVPIVLRAKATR